MTKTFAKIRSVFFRLLFKCVEKSLFLFTRLRYRDDGDPTRILVDHFTLEQVSALAELEKRRLQPVAPRDKRLLIVIPFRDAWPLTERCLKSLVAQKVNHLEVRICLIDNGSVEVTTLEALKHLQAPGQLNTSQIAVVRYDIPFNFSRLNNMAIRDQSSFNPDFLLLLNNDIEMRDELTLMRFVQGFQTLPHVGAVGCTLVYPDERVQHLFIAPGIKLVGAHPLKGISYRPQDAWYAGPRPVAAATGAALLVRSEDYWSVGGLEELLPTTGQDVDLCLKLQQKGKINWVLPDIVMTHAETATRTKVHSRAEIGLIYQKWGSRLAFNDYFSRQLSRWSEVPVLSLGEGEFPWWLAVP